MVDLENRPSASQKWEVYAGEVQNMMETITWLGPSQTLIMLSSISQNDADFLV